jgi:ABC-type nitrate/sulfonate/bicarbonate transport system substrate-binding protein
MATKIEDFLKEKKIDPRRLLVASAELERLRLEDRKIRLAKRAARKSEDPAKKKEGLAATKPRSGRPVTQEAINAAFAGKTISGPQKSRILRALNHVLETKKQEKIELAAIFEPTPRPKKKVVATE